MTGPDKGDSRAPRLGQQHAARERSPDWGGDAQNAEGKQQERDRVEDKDADDRRPDASRDDDDKEAMERRRNAAAAALTLEIVGDLPHADIKPPENVLFVCKLNPVTRSEDLELIFSRFGEICSCEVIRDKKVRTKH